MSGSTDPSPPCPLLDITIDLPADRSASLHDHLLQLPAKPGVYLLQDESEGALALASTANLRRMIVSRLEPPPDQSQSRRVNVRETARRVVATTVGSAFEADWAYLQLARQHRPHTYRAVLDRWQAWFIAIDPAAEFPQFVKTAHPGRQATGSTTVHFGPFADKHAAARYMDLQQDVFDLCRYHHVLVQAPHGSACAYKEMGRCPSPCDGTVGMQHYHEQMREAMNFAATPIEQWRSQTEQEMQRTSATLDFETARRLRERLERSKPAAKPSFAHVRRLEEFRFVGVCRAERKTTIRLFLIRGGWIEPFCDVHTDITKSDLNQILGELQNRAESQAQDLCDAALENLGLVCWHLFRPHAKRTTHELLRMDHALTAPALLRSIRRIARIESESPDDGQLIQEHEIDGDAISSP